MMKHWLAAAAAIACMTSAQALVTTVALIGDPSQSEEMTGSNFSGSLSFNDATNILTIDLMNTTPVAVGGFLTAFAFNAPDAATVTFASTTLATFNQFFTTPNTSPFNGLEYGVGVGDNYNGGGSPMDGLQIGDSATWTFNVSGGTFAATDFFTAGDEDRAVGFLTRFRGLADGGSDKVPGVPTMTPIPEPQTYALMLAGLGLVGFMARRRRRD